MIYSVKIREKSSQTSDSFTCLRVEKNRRFVSKAKRDDRAGAEYRL